MNPIVALQGIDNLWGAEGGSVQGSFQAAAITASRLQFFSFPIAKDTETNHGLPRGTWCSCARTTKTPQLEIN